MTGKPFYKTRTITSERLVSPLAGRRDLNDAAIAFKKAVLESITRPTLNAGLSVKALDSATGNETYKDTDGKKRTSKGGTPGMVELPNGYNYVPSQKWEEGKVLQLFPSIKSRKTAVKKPNFGWVDEPRSVTADEYAKVLAAKPKLRIRKYKVNKKTDEIIEESEQTLDPFSLNGDKTVNSSGYSEKRLPGKTIGQRGRSLIARAASAFGIIVDENGKFRCPPGTPAANQFTDNAGTNCFGISASEIFDFARGLASGIDAGGDTRVKNTTRKLFDFLSWVDNGGIPGLGRTVWRDPNGKRIRNIKKWREANKDGRSRVFVDGMIRAQDKLAQQDINIASLMDSLGVIRTDEKRKTNDDVFEVFQKLRDSGAWTIDTSTRLSKEDVDKIVKARLAHVPGFSGLSPERQKSLIEADTERWYATERALLESALDSFIADPEHMRTIAKINFQVKSPDNPDMDEASTSGITTPDTKRLMTVINVDIPEIMNNQEAMIPSLAPGERMRIDFVGGKTDSERATALTDFLVTVDGHSKQLAAMVEERAFARHIMKHEIAHTIQFQGFAREAERQIRTNGFITVLNDKGEPVKVENVKDLNSGMIFSLMKNASDGIDLESLKNALSRADVVGFLAGDYPKMYFNDEYGADYWALEATAELWALRDLGIIYGDDIDAALEWMDDVSDGRYIDIRRRSDADGLREIEARYYENLGPDPELSGNSISEVKKRLEIEHKNRLSQIQNWSNDTSTTSDDFVDFLADLQYRKESLNAAYDNLEASGESKDSPQFKEINRKIKETNDYISLIEKNWAERFSSPDSEKRKKDMKSMKESVRQKMFAEGKLDPEEMAARTRLQDIKDLEDRASRMTVDEFVQKLADIETSLKEPGISEGMKSELLEDRKMIRAIYKSRFSAAGDAKDWSKKKRELDKGIDEILNPPTPQVLAKRRLDMAHEKEMSNIEEWTTNNSTTNEKFIESLSGLQYKKEAYNDAFDDMEKNGVSKDSPDFKDLNRKIKENNEKISLIEKRWAERFSSEDRDRRSRDMRALRKSVREKMFSEGALRPKEMATRARQEEIKNLRQQTNDMNADEVVQKLADIETSLREPGLSSEAKSVLLEDKKIIRAIYKSKLEGSDDAKVWSKQRRELDTRIDEIVNPPRQQALKKSKKVKTDKAGATYAKKLQQDEYYAMSEEQGRAVERLGDPSLTDVGNLLDPDSNVAAAKNINRRYRKTQRSAGDLSPESETASLEDQIQKVLIPAMEAMDESSIPDDLEIETELYFGVTEGGFKDVSEYFDNQSFVSGRIITDESPHKPGEVRDADGDVVTRAGKEKTRVIVQVSKGDKGLFRINETELGDEGALVLPPGKMKVVDTRPDGTIVLRVQEQDNVVDVLDRVSSSIGEEGPGASQHAKGTKKKIDRVANKYVAQRRENGLSSTPSRPKREVEIEDKNVEIKREVISAGGSFGEPPSEDYVAEIGKAPLVQPAEADIKPDPVDPRTGRPQMKVVSRMDVEELVNRRAAVYRNLLDPDYANDKKGFQGTDRATLKSLDDELAKRGEITTNLPKPPEFDPDYLPGSGKRAPYKTSAGSVSDPTAGREVIGIPQTREERKVVRATRANMTFEDTKRVMAGESPRDVMNDMSRESLDPAVADIVARKSVEAILKDIEDAAVEFHAGIDKRPRVRMTESQLTKFADDGEFLPIGTDETVIPGDPIGRRLERRLNPGTRRSAPSLSSGRRADGPPPSPLAQASVNKSIERAEKARSRVDGLEKALAELERTGEWKGGEFGVILARGKDWQDLDGFDADIAPRNLTKEEVEEKGLADLKRQVEKKLDASKKELALQEFLARTKEQRIEQGILDIEDVPEEEYRMLVEEGRELRERSNNNDIEAFKLDGNQEAVIHVGKAQLDGGVLNPSRTSTAGLGSGSAGDTGALNKVAIRNFNQEFEEDTKKLSIYETTMSAINAGQMKFTPRNREEADAINSLLGLSSRYGAKEREELDLATLPLRDGMAPLIEDGNRRISELRAKQARDSKLAARINESPDFGFLSAYPASRPVTTGGFYGRNAAEDVPEDVVKYYTEAQNTARGAFYGAVDVKDNDMWGRWQDNLRGSAYLIIGDSDDTVVSNLGPSDERQLVGVNKPIFGVSSRIESGRQPQDYQFAAQALMARAIKLKKEGKEITPAAVLASRSGKPLDDSGFSSGRLSSGRRGKPSKTQRGGGVAGSRATGRVLDAVLKRSGADEDTRERVKYGVNMSGALAAGGPAGFATALAVDVARRAGREIAERGLEEAVQRGRITQNQMDVAMSAVDRVAPNGLPDPVVDRLADAWTVASDFIDERVVTDENRQRLDEFGNTIRSGGSEFVENAGQIVGSAREKIGKRFGRGKSKPSETDPFGDFDATPATTSTSILSEYDDPFAGFNENDYTPAKTEYDPFGDSAFSSGKRAGRSSDAFRDEYNSRIGISKSTPNSAKPVSGYVVHRSHNEEKKRRIAAAGKGNIGSDAIFEIGDNDVVGDGLTALGEIEVILKPEVSNRTAYGRGEALQSAHRPVAMNSNDPDDIADAIMNADGIASKKQNTEAMLHLLGAKMDKNFSSVNASMDENGKMAPVGAVDSSTRAHEPFEAQILGGFKKNEVEGIHYPYSKVAKIAESEDISDVVNDKSLASKLEKLGFTPEEVAYFYSISGGKPLNTASMAKLKEYRSAKKIKEKYEGMGIGYVKFAHPQGINIENPRSYDKTASPTARVDEILKRSIDAEVEAELKKTLDSIRKSGQLDLMVD